MYDQMSMEEFVDPFTGEKNKIEDPFKGVQVTECNRQVFLTAPLGVAGKEPYRLRKLPVILVVLYIRYTVSCLFLYLILPIFSIVVYLPFRYNSAHRRSGGMS